MDGAYCLCSPSLATDRDPSRVQQHCLAYAKMLSCLQLVLSRREVLVGPGRLAHDLDVTKKLLQV